MFEDNEHAIARISVINDEINRALGEGPDITDIPDEAYSTANWTHWRRQT